MRGLCLTRFGVGDQSARGVAISAGSVHSAVVIGNFIGVMPDGETAAGNTIGVDTVSQLGGTDPASRNIISGNYVGLSGTRVDGLVVQGNYIGTNASGSKKILNHYGISISGGNAGGSPCIGTAPTNPDLSKTIIGGTAAGAGNVISGNLIAMEFGRTDLCAKNFELPIRIHGVRIQGNLIGVQSDGVGALRNESGIVIRVGSDNLVGGLEPGAGNVIAFNGSGVVVQDGRPSVNNQILSNSIYANRIGIDLNDDGRTVNDLGDSDSGPNNLQNYPVIDSVSVTNGSATFTGTLNATANTQFTLQYFSESADLARPVQTYLGSSTVTTDANGNARFSATFPASASSAGFNMTATSQDGNTSEFSRVPPRLRNISTRAFVGTGDQVMIAGFIFSLHSGIWPAAVRALGPSLQPTVAGALSDPTLELHPTGRAISRNDNWADGYYTAQLPEAGLAPANSLESALWTYVDGGGTYTAIVAGAGGATGVGLAEVYDVGDAGAELLNISTRGFVGTKDNVLIAGTILEQTTGSTRIVARAMGPSLATAGVAGALADPMLELHDSQGTIIASNDNWRDGQPDALTEVGLAPTNDSESAIFVRLAAGAYTAVVRGKGDATGNGLVELYNLH